jgi:hypothetical protein
MGSLAGALIAALAGCGPAAAPSSAPHALAAPAATTAAAVPASASSCQERDGKADTRCTPGVRNAAVTQANIGSTICRSGWTKTVRPSTSYTNGLKRTDLTQYGLTGPMSAYELDHLIPLELGGNPTDPHNLWPEPWDGSAGAHAKDTEENSLHRAVCGGRMKLADAQARVLRHWTWSA